MCEPKAPPTNPVQIVFVHGLNGSKRGTWTFSKEQFWPEWLHEENGLDDVRIATFGYNSSTNILKPNTNLSIPIFANQLLRWLKRLCDNRGSVLIYYIELMIGSDNLRSAQLGRIGSETGTNPLNFLIERLSLRRLLTQNTRRCTGILRQWYF